MHKEIKNIVWLASYPKSGNTWFRIFLSNLLNDDGEAVNINQLHSSSIASSRVLFDNNCGISSTDLTMYEVEELRPEVYRQIAKNSSELLFFKVHDAWKKTPSGKELFPKNLTKSVIYFIRNPLDVAVSFAFHTGNSPSKMVASMGNHKNAFCQKPDRSFNQLKQVLSDWSGHAKSWIDDSGLAVHVVRYEDMLDNTFNTFKIATLASGIETSDKNIRIAIKASDFSLLSKKENEEGFKEKPIEMKAFFRSGSAGNWREHLSQDNVNVLIKEHGSLMERFGYLKENNLVF